MTLHLEATLEPALGALGLETGVEEVALASFMLELVLVTVVVTTIPARHCHWVGLDCHWEGLSRQASWIWVSLCACICEMDCHF